MLAETVSFTEQEMLIILLVLLGFLVLTVAAFVLGCFWAWRAGRGSQAALVGWIVVGPLVLVPAVLVSLPGVVRGSFSFIFPACLLATQGALYFASKSTAEPRE